MGTDVSLSWVVCGKSRIALIHLHKGTLIVLMCLMQSNTTELPEILRLTRTGYSDTEP